MLRSYIRSILSVCYNKRERNIMPVHAVRSAGGKIIGWQFGTTGKIYKTKQEAEEQERAIRASGWSGDGNSVDNWN